MNTKTSEGRDLVPKDFWVNRSPIQVLADSNHELLMKMELITFFSQSLLNPNLSSDEIQELAQTLSSYVESVNSIIQAVKYYLNDNVRSAAENKSE
jgi:hypothetical protein